MVTSIVRVVFVIGCAGMGYLIGLQIVETLTTQINGSLELTTDKGTSAKIVIPLSQGMKS